MNTQNIDYDEHIKTSFRGFHNNPKWSDGTMVTDDFDAIQGHKLMLSQASPLLDKLMMFNNPLIYLRGVKSEVLKMILVYVYTGSGNHPHSCQTSRWHNLLSNSRNSSKEILLSLLESITPASRERVSGWKCSSGNNFKYLTTKSSSVINFFPSSSWLAYFSNIWSS